MALPSGVCWWLKKESVPVDVFSMVGGRKGIRPQNLCTSYPSWNVLSLHSFSFNAIFSPPFPVWKGHGGMVLNKTYGEGEWNVRPVASMVVKMACVWNKWKCNNMKIITCNEWASLQYVDPCFQSMWLNSSRAVQSRQWNIIRDN